MNAQEMEATDWADGTMKEESGWPAVLKGLDRRGKVRVRGVLSLGSGRKAKAWPHCSSDCRLCQNTTRLSLFLTGHTTGTLDYLSMR